MINRNTCQSSCITSEKDAYGKRTFRDESNIWGHRSSAKVCKLEEKYLTEHSAGTVKPARKLCPLFHLNYTKLVKMLRQKKKNNQNTFSKLPNWCQCYNDEPILSWK